MIFDAELVDGTRWMYALEMRTALLASRYVPGLVGGFVERFFIDVPFVALPTVDSLRPRFLLSCVAVVFLGAFEVVVEGEK